MVIGHWDLFRSIRLIRAIRLIYSFHFDICILNFELRNSFFCHSSESWNPGFISISGSSGQARGWQKRAFCNSKLITKQFVKITRPHCAGTYFLWSRFFFCWGSGFESGLNPAISFSWTAKSWTNATRSFFRQNLCQSQLLNPVRGLSFLYCVSIIE